MGSILFIVGAVIAFVGFIIVLIEAFKEHILWGLASLFINIVLLIFVIMHWDRAKKGFGYMVIGWAVMFLGFLFSPKG